MFEDHSDDLMADATESDYKVMLPARLLKNVCLDTQNMKLS